MNDAYRTYFPSAPPARATIRAALAGPQYSVEITFIAASSPRRAITAGLPPNFNLPLSPAVVAGDRAYLSGALGNDETNKTDSGRTDDGDAREAARHVGGIRLLADGCRRSDRLRD